MWKSGRLTGERIYLRAYRTSDAQALSDMTARDEIYRTTYNIQREFDVSHARWWIKFNANCRRTGTSYEFGIFENGTDRLIGQVESGHCHRGGEGHSGIRLRQTGAEPRGSGLHG